MRFVLILSIVFFSTNIFSIENNKLISEIDLIYLFDNNKKKWNETIVFLDKKKSLSKLNGFNDTYFLESFFDNGSVLIMPYFKNESVSKFVFTYKLNNIDEQIKNLFIDHFKSFEIFCSTLSINKSYLNIEIIKCN